MCPFECAYGFIPLTPLDLLPLPLTEKKGMSLDGAKRAEQVKKLHEKIKIQIETKNSKVADRVNKGRRKVIFQPGDWVWIHLRKERFPEHRKSKLMPRGDGPFQVIQKVNDNAYKIDLKGKYNVSSTFNVSDLSLFDDTDSWSNPFQEEENDTTPVHEDTISSSFHGPVTRSRANQLQSQLNGYLASQDRDQSDNSSLDQVNKAGMLSLSIVHVNPKKNPAQVQVSGVNTPVP